MLLAVEHDQVLEALSQLQALQLSNKVLHGV